MNTIANVVSLLLIECTAHLPHTVCVEYSYEHHTIYEWQKLRQKFHLHYCLTSIFNEPQDLVSDNSLLSVRKHRCNLRSSRLIVTYDIFWFLFTIFVNYHTVTVRLFAAVYQLSNRNKRLKLKSDIVIHRCELLQKICSELRLCYPSWMRWGYKISVMSIDKFKNARVQEGGIRAPQ